MINRTAERVLSLIGAIFNGISLIVGVIIAFIFNLVKSDPAAMEEMKYSMISDGVMTMEEIDMFMSLFSSFIVLIWIAIAVAFIGLVLNIIGIVKIWNNANPKAAGILFIIAGIFSGILSLTSILLYIAAILCFTKKPPYAPQPSPDEVADTQTNWMA